MSHKEKNHSTEIDTEFTQMLELADKDIKRVTQYTLCVQKVKYGNIPWSRKWPLASQFLPGKNDTPGFRQNPGPQIPKEKRTEP